MSNLNQPDDSSTFASTGESAWGGDPTLGQNTFMQTLQAERERAYAKQGVVGKPLGRWVRWRLTLLIVWRAAKEYSGQFVKGLRWLTRRWLNQNPGRVTQILEIGGWPLVLITLSAWANPANPLYVNEGFPWPWLGTWLVALRYGVLAGLFGVLEMLLAWWLLGSGAVPRLYFLGGAITTLLAGEFGSYWGMRTVRAKESIEHLNDKIERLTRRLYLLKLSHDELEYEMVDRPGTLRDALMQLREMMDHEQRLGMHPQRDGRLPAAKSMLQLLANYTQVEVAGMYLIRRGPIPELESVAKIGSARTPEVTNPMVIQAVESRQSVHVQDSLLDQIDRDSCLLVAPLLDEEGEAFGLLAVNRIPFMGVHHDNLRHIWVLVQAYSEYLRTSRLGEEYQPLWPQAPLELRQEFARLAHMNQRFGIKSHCVVWRIFSRRAPVIAEHLRQAHRGGELVWLFRAGDELKLVSLFAFADSGQVAVAISRIFEAARQRGGLSADAIAKVSTEEIPLALPRAYQMMVDELSDVSADSSITWEDSV